MAVSTSSAFADALRASRALESAHQEQVTNELAARFDSASTLAKELIQRGWLTTYQANQILQGHASGLVLGSYVLLDRLGEGGMGEVFKARHQRMKRIVALKIIRPDKIANSGAIQRFNREIEAAAQLMHPNIVVAYDAAEVGGLHFFVMEYVRGIDLAKLVRETGPLSVGQACDFIRQAALGLQHAHERGLVHRDIKPANLLVTARHDDPDGTSRSAWETGVGPGGIAVLKILDMGLARLREANASEQSALTQEGMVMGTPDFIAPEQAVDSRSVDIRADVYSLGCSFYFLLTGVVPYPGGTIFEKLYKHRFVEPEPVEQIRAEVPQSVGEVVRRMMAKEPAQRFQLPGEVARALEPFAKAENAPSMLQETEEIRLDEGALSQTQPPTLPTQGGPVETMRAPDGYFPATLDQVGNDGTLPSLPPPESRTSPEPLPLRPARRTVLNPDYASLRPEDVTAVGNDQVTQVPATRPTPGYPAPGASRPKSSLTALLVSIAAVTVVVVAGVTGWATLYRNSDSATKSSGVAQATEPMRPPASPEDNQSARTQPNQPATPKSVVATESPKAESAPETKEAIAARAKDVPSSEDKLAKTVPETMGKSKESKAPEIARKIVPKIAPKKLLALGVIRVLGGPRYQLKNAAMSSDGRFIAASSKDRDVRVWDLEHDSGEAESPRILENCAARCVAVSLDGRQVLYGTTREVEKQGQVDPILRQEVCIWDVGSRDAPRSAHGHDAPLTCIAFSPDGQQALSGGEDRTVRLWDLRGESPVPRLIGRHGSKVLSVSFSPDGHQALSSGADYSVRYWDLDDGKELKVLKGHDTLVTSVGFAPDGKRAVSGSRDRTARVWDLIAGNPICRVTVEGAVLGVAFAPDGQSFATGGDDKVVSIWDARTGSRIATLAGHTKSIQSFAYAYDGKHLLSVSDDNTVRRWELAKTIANPDSIAPAKKN